MAQPASCPSIQAPTTQILLVQKLPFWSRGLFRLPILLFRLYKTFPGHSRLPMEDFLGYLWTFQVTYIRQKLMVHLHPISQNLIATSYFLNFTPTGNQDPTRSQRPASCTWCLKMDPSPPPRFACVSSI
jgi:hypothetical protein